jgi:hypothetical protein
MKSFSHWVWLDDLQGSYLCSIVLLSIIYCLLPVREVMAISVAEMDGKDPIIIELSIFILDINSIDTVEQNFTANLFFEARWHDPDLVHLGPNPITKQLSEIWRPNIQAINQQHVWESFPEAAEITPEGLVSYRQRLWGDFSQKMNLKDFPFDRQTFKVQFVAAGYNPGQIELVSDKGRKTGYQRVCPNQTGTSCTGIQNLKSMNQNQVMVALLAMHLLLKHSASRTTFCSRS